MRCFTRLSALLLVFLSCFTIAFAAPADQSGEAAPAVVAAPLNPPVTGGYYLSGKSDRYGDCDLFFPVADGWCLNDGGFLTRFDYGTLHGLLVTSSGQRLDVRASAYDLPRVSDTDRYYDLRFVPSGGNINVHTTFEPHLGLDDCIALFDTFLLAFLVLVLLTKKR